MVTKRKVIYTCVLIACVCLGGYLAKSNKYYVKRFIKEHKFLYVPAQKLADMKYSLTQLMAGESTPVQVNQSTLTRSGPWTLRVDASQGGVPFDRFWGNLGYESFKNGILNSQNRQLFEMMQEANQESAGSFRFIRAHNLFSDGKPPWGEGCVKVTLDDSGNLICDWSLADQAFDRILKYGFTPIVEFGFMPDALASIPDRRQKWGKANISPPKDYDLWRDLVYRTVAHLVERYGSTELNTWYFEVWNEPDHARLFWIEDPEHKPWGDLKEYFKLYDYAVDGAKAALPSIRVGGPASAGLGVGEFLEHAYLRKNNVTGVTGSAVDFVSSHAYGKIYPANRRKGKKNIVSGIKMKLDRAMHHDHKKVGRKMRDLPFLLTETGPRTRGADFFNTRYLAAWWAKLVDASFFMGEKWGEAYQPDEIVYWASEQVVKSFRDGSGIGVSLRTMDGRKVFKRPSFNIMALLGHLGDERLPEVEGAEFGDAVHALVTRHGEESVQIMVYHLAEWDYDCTSPDSQEVRILVESLPFSSFRVDSYAIDAEHSNIYSAWKDMGRPEPLDSQQMAILDRSDDLVGYEQSYTIESADNKFEKEVKLQSNSVSLFVLTRELLTN